MNNSNLILIVDDNPENLKVITNFLKDEGYRLALALNGHEALKIAMEVQPDLILLDIMMPDLNGYEVCNRMKNLPELKSIPIIFISALTETADIVKAFQTGGVDYITKPFQSEEVKSRVATHLKIRKQNKELIQLNTDKDRFLSILSHDLKSPMNGILGYLELLLTNFNSYSQDELFRRINIVNEYATTTYSLLEDILMWTRSQSGKLPFEPIDLKISILFEEVISRLKLIASSKNISLIHFTDSDIILRADRNMLSSVLFNLTSNALKFTNSGGEVRIFAEQAPHETLITVSDNGVGLSPEAISKLFDISTVKSTRGTANEKGTGLGLLLCKEFVEKHGGKIWVESALGAGCDVKIKIPQNITTH